MKNIFVSYSSKDEDSVLGLRAALSSYLRGQCQFFVAANSIEGGADFVATIKQNLQSADVVVVLCTADSIKSPWVLMEIGAAWALDKKIEPVRLGPEPVALPEPINHQQFWDVPTLQEPYRLDERKVVEGFVKQFAHRLLGVTESRLELHQRIDKRLEDVKHDYHRIRQRLWPERTTIRNHETVELSNVYVDLSHAGVKSILGPLWDPLWEKYELVRNMWDEAKDWNDFEQRWAELDRKLAQLTQEPRFLRRVDDNLGRAVPELAPFAGQLVEMVVCENPTRQL
jgi:hypothetical protein